MKNKKNKILIFLLIIIIFLIASAVFLVTINKNKTELKSIKSKKQLEKIYYGQNYNTNYDNNFFKELIGLPFTFFENLPRKYYRNNYNSSIGSYMKGIDIVADSVAESAAANSSSSPQSTEVYTKDYSKTNIQVENVDEADITKTDGNYIYSLSENNVIITDVRNPEDIKIASKINLYGSIPEDLLLYNDKLVVIYTESTSSWRAIGNTIVVIYDITERENPISLKSFTLFEPYYTCRCIDNNLYVISSGKLRLEDNEIATYYSENSQTKEIPLNNIYYLTSVNTDTQTLISKVDLNDTKADISINSYLIDISNCYVSENSIYLLNYNYEYNYRHNNPPIRALFTLKGVFGIANYEYDYDYIDNGYNTDIYKFDILNDGSIKYYNKATTKGQTINQYSLDEFQGNLRIALYDNNGSKVVIYDGNMNLIGESSYVAKGEKMYSSRFIENKVYFVTFKNMDPLFVMDLSDPRHPTVLGELKIPGYSTYLHPYDENHLIGIGMETEEQIYRDSYGRITSTSSIITGMKMALFDVSDVTKPKEISKTVIGDRRTTSAILTNPKALLFSREKELIAIPVNNYADDFSVAFTENNESAVSYYSNRSKSYLSEGYLVYKINLDEGFNLKGIITHDNIKTNYYYTKTRLLRGLYIDNNLYTVSETSVKVNKLDNLEQISELKIINNIKQDSKKIVVEEVY